MIALEFQKMHWKYWKKIKNALFYIIIVLEKRIYDYFFFCLSQISFSYKKKTKTTFLKLLKTDI